MGRHIKQRLKLETVNGNVTTDSLLFLITKQ